MSKLFPMGPSLRKGRLSKAQRLQAACLDTLEHRRLLSVAIGVDWGTTVATATDQSYGVNTYAGADPAVANNAAYQANMKSLSPGLIRIHAGDTVSSSGGRGWLNADNSWNASKIDSMLTGLDKIGAQEMITINSWPSSMDTNADGQLDTNQYGAFASWCASLARITNVTYGHHVTYFELFNEQDGGYYNDNPSVMAAIYNQAAVAIKQVDSSIKVGGPAFTNCWKSGLGGFIASAKNNLDFISYHAYASGNASDSDASIYNSAAGTNGTVNWVKARLSDNGVANIPVFLNEYNISWTYQTYDSRMTNNKGAVYDALTMKSAIEAGVTSVDAWNDVDGVYGKMDPSYNIRLPGRMQSLAHQYLVGRVNKVTTGDSSQMEGYAVSNANGKSLLLINRSGASNTANLSWGGWTPSNSTVSITQITASGLSTSTIQFSALSSFAMADNSVAVLRFGDGISVPGMVQAEDYDSGGEGVGYHDATAGNQGGAYRGDAVDISGTSDAGGGYAVVNTAAGEWLKYTINVLQSGSYDLQVRFASQWGTSFHVEIDGTDVTGNMGWQTWGPYATAVKHGVGLTAGSHEVKLVFNDSGATVNWLNFVRIEEAPYGGVAASIPGLIQAENYDVGGETVAYHTQSTSNQGGQYRNDTVSIYGNNGSYYIGTSGGDWFKYTVNVSEAGRYNIQVRFAAQWGASFHVELDGTDVTGSMGWQTWSDWQTAVAPGSVPITAGQHILKLAVSYGASFDSISLIPVEAPYGGIAVPLAGKIEAENYDTGGEGIAYHDLSSGNQGGQYRTNDVDIVAADDGTYAVSSQGGEWLKYTVNVTQTGTYSVQARFSSYWGCTFHLEIDGTPVTGGMGWQTWSDNYTTTQVNNIQISSGTHVLKVVIDIGYVNLNWFDFMKV